MKRREFIILTGVGATSSTLLSACGHPEEKLISALIPDDQYVPGVDYWKASTCGMCPAGCGIIVRTREHKANKIEGNPLHPVNRGALCARGQAGLEVLYNPDRINGPMKRVGERGEGKWEEISWEEAIKTLADKLHEIKAQGRASSVYYAARKPFGVNGVAASHFLAAFGSPGIVVQGLFEGNTLSAYARSFDLRGGTPTFDIANATYLISFGARFLETWLSPVMYSLAYGEFRRASGKVRGKFVHVEPRMSLTAANADEWLPAAPGTEDFVALALAQVMIRESLVKETVSAEFASALEEYAPEKTADLSGIPPERIIRIAREFAGSERPLAIFGSTALSSEHGDLNAPNINLLNALANNIDVTGGLFPPREDEFEPLEALLPQKHFRFTPFFALHRGLLDQTVSALMVHEMNPVYLAPSLIEGVRAVPFIASFSSFMDETTQLADLILPDHAFLESWDIKTVPAIRRNPVTTLFRPVVKPEFNTRQTADALIEVSSKLGTAAPFESAEQIVRLAGSELAKLRGSISAVNEEEFWNAFVERGVWIGDTATGTSDICPTVAKKLRDRMQSELSHLKLQRIQEIETKKTSGYPFTVLAYESATLGTGEQANIPSLQELPDSMTSTMWGSWIEMNPKTAATLGIAEGDLVEVTTNHGSLRGPAVIYPAIRPDVIAVPFGQGHTAYGRYATGRGENAAHLDPFITSYSGIQTHVADAQVSKVGGKADLIRFGTDLWQQFEKKR